jgi:F-type H+-transporting ATPase subunit a
MENEFTFAIGPIVIGLSLITTWGIMLAIPGFQPDIWT